MTRVEEVPDQVQWHEGMLLSPQHFQQLSLRADVLLQYQLWTLAPFHWGVRRLEIDSVALLTGLYRVTELEAIMPDGMIVTHQAGGGEELQVSLADQAGAAAEAPLVVQLLVPSRRAAARGALGEAGRFVSYEAPPVADMNTGDREVPIPRLRPKLTLAVTSNPAEKYVNLPLARVGYRDEAFNLTDYIPPSLSVPPQSDLARLCSDIVQRVREKAAYLADRARATTAAEQEPIVIAQRRLAYCLGAGLPPAEALLRSGVAHPHSVYMAMCGLVGLSAGAGPAILPPTLEGYDHADLKRSFQQIVGFFDDLLATIREEHRRLTFDDVGGAFDLAMRPRWLSGGSLIVGVVPGAGVAESEVVTWFERSLIAATTRMATARERRVRGCGRRQVLAPEAMGLAPRRSEVIFAIDVDTQYLQEGDTLQIVHPVHGERGRPREVVLYVADQT